MKHEIHKGSHLTQHREISRCFKAKSIAPQLVFIDSSKILKKHHLKVNKLYFSDFSRENTIVSPEEWFGLTKAVSKSYLNKISQTLLEKKQQFPLSFR